MLTEPLIRIGIITDGEQVLTAHPGGTLVENLLIGEGFHWQRSMCAVMRGTFEPLEPAQGNIRMINLLPVEQYVESVIASEMNPNAPTEFLKAHAVISRSWALRKVLGCHTGCQAGRRDSLTEHIGWEESDEHTGFDVCSDDHCQRYQGIPARHASRACEAVRATRGVVLADSAGEIADARFSKCCGGRTEIFSTCWSDRDYDYLASVPDPWCASPGEEVLHAVLKEYDAETHDFHDWQKDIDPAEVTSRLRERYGADIGKITDMNAIDRGPSGRIRTLLLTGTHGSVTIGKELPIRRLLAADCLKSSWFEIRKEKTTFRLIGHGWGHGVGLCQIGAASMAAAGHDFRSILEFYYPNASLKLIYE